MPGDRVKADVYAKYLGAEEDNWSDALAQLVNFLQYPATAPANVIIDGGGYGSSGITSLGITPIGHGTDPNNGAPKAYLNFIFINKKYDPASLRMAFAPITTEAEEDGSDNKPHEHLTLDEAITEEGYVYVYISNDNPQERDVYFDDFNVEHIKSPIIQSQDFYPFGLTYNSYSREDALNSKWKFQSQQHLDALDLNWDSFKWRNHQPEIGRFFNLDPLAEKYYYNSPYAFSENKVVAHIELEGLESLIFARAPLVGRGTVGATSRLARTGEFEWHHIIARAFRYNRTVQQARREGFKFEGQENKIELEKFSKQTAEGRHGSHPSYNKELGERLKNFETENPGASGPEALDFIRNTVKDLKGTIENNPATKINDLFKGIEIDLRDPSKASDATLYRGPSMEEKAAAKEFFKLKKAVEIYLSSRIRCWRSSGIQIREKACPLTKEVGITDCHTGYVTISNGLRQIFTNERVGIKSRYPEEI